MVIEVFTNKAFHIVLKHFLNISGRSCNLLSSKKAPMTASIMKQEDFLFDHFRLSQQQLISYKIFWVDHWLNYCWDDVLGRIGGLDLPSIGRAYKSPPPAQLLLLSNGQKIELFDRNKDYLLRSILEDSGGDIGASDFNRQWISENSNNKELEAIAKRWEAFLKEECNDVIEEQENEGIRLITSSLPLTVRNLKFAKQEKEQHWDWEISNGLIMLTCSEDHFNDTIKPYLDSGQADYLDSNSGPLLG
ncbi:hypothetical protein PMIT1320_01144 [Prochlorococcus marinus str. MIT 1320]|nr:hypothetical protein PMIT1320_01144 [Prochlorococcus marinus str. MIT 1320]